MQEPLQKPAFSKQALLHCAGIVGAGLLYSLGINLFVVPTGLYTGGIMGFAQLLRTLFLHLTGLESTTVFMSLIPRTDILHGDQLAECLIGGILCGCGIGITLWMGGTTGGMDVIGMMLIKKGSHTSIGHVNLFWNMALYAICAAAFNLSTAIYSILFSFISTTAMDKLHMQNINVEVTVVTKVLSPEMEHEILVDLHRGITRYEGIGEYTGEPVHIFYILVTKYEISRLRAIVCKHDPHAFIVAKDGAVVYGNYKRKL